MIDDLSVGWVDSCQYLLKILLSIGIVVGSSKPDPIAALEEIRLLFFFKTSAARSFFSFFSKTRLCKQDAYNARVAYDVMKDKGWCPP